MVGSYSASTSCCALSELGVGASRWDATAPVAPRPQSALEKLEASHATVKRDEKTLGLAANAFAASYIDNPPERDSWLLTMGGWLRTHPRNQDRIERLLA